MHLNLTDIGPTPTARELYEFEEWLGQALPSDFRSHVLEFNGGYPEEPIGLLFNDELIQVVNFYDLRFNGDPNERDGVWGGYMRLCDFGHTGYLPVGSANYTQDFCLDLHDPETPVYYVVFEHDKVFLNDVIDVHFHRVADNFTDFLDRLVEIPVEYCRIEELAEKGTPADLEAYLAEGNSIDAKGKHDEPLLIRSISRENIPMLDACLAHGANLSQALHRAAKFDIEAVRKLLEAGADVNEKNEHEKRPLGCVIGTALPGERGANNRAKRDLLLEYGAFKDTHARD